MNGTAMQAMVMNGTAMQAMVMNGAVMQAMAVHEKAMNGMAVHEKAMNDMAVNGKAMNGKRIDRGDITAAVHRAAVHTAAVHRAAVLIAGVFTAGVFAPTQALAQGEAESLAAMSPAVNVSASAPRARDTLDLGTTSITGNQELPKVLYIVPWKRSDLGDLVGRPTNTLLDEVLAPVDPEVFERHLGYYATLYEQSGETSADGRRDASPEKE